MSESLPLSLQQPGLELRAETRNLSASGIYCTVDRFVAPMTKFEVRLQLHHGQATETVTCTGVVVRVDPVIESPDRPRYQIAIFFSDISERHRQHIARFVAERIATGGLQPNR